MATNIAFDFSQHDFQFTRNWFINRNLPTFSEYIYPKWAGKKASYLEIGVWEGQSLAWMMQYVLTHSESKAVGVDPWLLQHKHDSGAMGLVMGRAHHNLAIYPKCTLIQANSRDYMTVCLTNRPDIGSFRKRSVDLCMIDGNHTADAVYTDATLAIQMIRKGGWLIFDDLVGRIPKRNAVVEGLAKFLSEHSKVVKRLWTHGQMEAYQKL